MRALDYHAFPKQYSHVSEIETYRFYCYDIQEYSFVVQIRPFVSPRPLFRKHRIIRFHICKIFNIGNLFYKIIFVFKNI